MLSTLRNAFVLTALITLLASVPAPAQCPPGTFIRGDVDANGSAGFADGIGILDHVASGLPIASPLAVDVNDNGVADVGDAVDLFHFVFGGGPAPVAPYPGCGTDPTPGVQLPDPTPELHYSWDSIAVEPGDDEWHLTYRVTNSVPLAALTMRMTYDPAVVDLLSLDTGGFCDLGGCVDFNFVDLPAPGEARVTIVASLTGSQFIPPLTDFAVGELVFKVPDTAPPGPSTVAFEDDLGSSPPGLNLGCQEGLILIPTTSSGIIDVAGSLPAAELGLSDHTVSPGDAFAAVLSLDTPVDIAGLSLNICHENGVLNVLDIAAGADLATANGGAEPSFLMTAVNPSGIEGAHILSVIDFSGVNTLLAGAGHEIAVVDYEVEATQATITELRLCNDFELGPETAYVNDLVMSGGTSIPFSSTDGTVTVEERQFIRGDANADGIISIADPITILAVLFQGLPVACAEASDTNADGLLSLPDAIGMLFYFSGTGTPPAAPFPGCGDNPGGSLLGCDNSACP